MDDWLTLFRRALAIIDAAPPGTIPDDWTVGGGTMLFRRFGHRLSRDIDIFLSSPQSLPALSPRLNDEAARRIEPAGGYVEQSHFLKFSFPDGDIDFIVAPHLLTPFATAEQVAGRLVWIETPAEILAKKVLYRADDFTARDLFDFAYLIGTGDAEALLAEDAGLRDRLQAVGLRLEIARDMLRKAFSRLPALSFHPTYEMAEHTVRAFLARANA